MKHRKITPESTVEAGEYLFYEPAAQIVLCASYNRKEGSIRAFVRGQLMEDKTENFKKIELTPTERREGHISGCKGCKGG
tara:strand:+ start:57 stop:296 length:240 start_codon:yes stop_codon:yes gene_type:complete